MSVYHPNTIVESQKMLVVKHIQKDLRSKKLENSNETFLLLNDYYLDAWANILPLPNKFLLPGLLKLYKDDKLCLEDAIIKITNWVESHLQSMPLSNSEKTAHPTYHGSCLRGLRVWKENNDLALTKVKTSKDLLEKTFMKSRFVTQLNVNLSPLPMLKPSQDQTKEYFSEMKDDHASDWCHHERCEHMTLMWTQPLEIWSSEGHKIILYLHHSIIKSLLQFGTFITGPVYRELSTLPIYPPPLCLAHLDNVLHMHSDAAWLVLLLVRSHYEGPMAFYR
ncbi:hypothetical protein EV363DRAFT_1297748 [Boletus edulis]|nr:hypothetical protein EV363DRAFT_1297748 [Boletus edulis]